MDWLTLYIVSGFAVIFALTTVYCLTVIRRQQRKLRHLSETDPLTGWLNRRALENTLGREFERCSRVGSRLSLIMFDVDHFNAFNDKHGHDIGDLALRHVTTLAETELRGYDHVFRVNSEQFAICLPDTDTIEVTKIAERLRRRVYQTPLNTAELQLQISISIGCAALSGADQHFEDILKKAEQALRAAKQPDRGQTSQHVACSSALIQAH